MKEPTLAINAFSSNEEDLLSKQNLENLERIRNQYRVSYYDPACEDHNKIEKIIPVSKSFLNLLFYALQQLLQEL